MDGNGMTKSQHVVPNRDGGWAVRKDGAYKASRVFPRQREALQYAREIARRDGAELYVHRGDGTISERDSYREDPAPPVAKR